MTIVQLAESSGLSHPFISQLERGLARPSMSSLFRIAETLGTDQHVLLAESVAVSDGSPAVVRRSGDGAAVASNGSVQALVPGSDHPFIPMEFVGDETTWDTYWRHAEDEFVYVVSGRLRIDLDGSVSELEVGDSVYVPGGVAHRWASADGELFRLVVVKERFRPG